MKRNNHLANEKGVVLVTGLVFLAVLTLIGTGAYITTSNELDISRNYRLSKKAFYDAEAGVEYALAMVEDGLAAATPLVLPTSTSGPVTVPNATAPGDFYFTLSTISYVDVNTYLVTINTVTSQGSKAEIAVTFQRDTEPAMSLAAFGDQAIIGKNAATYVSYNSESGDPNNDHPSDAGWSSTGEADIGSNGELDLKSGTVVDGDGYLGEDSPGGTDATITDPSVVDEVKPVDWVDPDPLGIDDGGKYDPTSYSDSADHDNDDYGIPTSLNLSGTLTLCGKPGGANYYFTDLVLKNGASLVVDTTGDTCATTGPVNIFVDNTSAYIDFKNGSSMNTTGNATDFTLFSNTTGKIDLKHGGDFTGLIYAPKSDIDIKNSGNLYGAAWGNTVETKNSGIIYYDTALKDKYSVESDDVVISSWRNVRN